MGFDFASWLILKALLTDIQSSKKNQKVNKTF